MPSNTLTLVTTVDTRSGNRSIGEFNRSLSSIELAAARASQSASRSIQGLEGAVVRSTASIQQRFSVLGSILGAGAIQKGLGLLQQAATASVQIAADFERAQIGLQAFTGSQEKATRLFGELQQFAQKSPFEFRDLLRSTNQLLAYNTALEDVIPTLRAVTAAGGALNFDAGKLNDLINALGQIRAAGRLTGEEIRQLRNAGVPVLDILSKGFGKTAAEMDKAVRGGLVPAEAAIRVILRGLEERFGAFDQAVGNTASVAISNLRDALDQVANEAAKNFLPAITRAINDLRPVLISLGRSFGEVAPRMLDFAGGVAQVGAAFATYQIVARIEALKIGLTGLTAALTANPWALAAAGVVLLGTEVYRQTKRLEEMADASRKLERSEGIRKLVNQGKTVQELEKLGFSVDDVKAAFSRASVETQNYSFDLDYGVKVVKGAGRQIEQLGQSLDEQAKAAKRVADAEKRTAQILREAKDGELDSIARILQQYREYRAELGLSARANRDLAQATVLRLQAEASAALRRNGAEVVNGIRDELRANTELYQRKLEDARTFEDETSRIVADSVERQLAVQGRAIEQRRDAELRALEGLSSSTIEQATAIEQQRLAIEQRAIDGRLALQVEEISRRRDLELDYLNFLQKLYPEQAQAITQRSGAIAQAAARDIAIAERAAAEDGAAAREQAAIRTNQIIRDRTLDTFNQIRDGAGRIFDQMVQDGGNAFEQLGKILKVALLTAMREVVSNQIARVFTQFVSGRSVALSGGGSAQGGLGGILGALGVGAAPVLAGVGAAGAPGGTPGFAGPVGGGGFNSAGGGVIGNLGSAAGLAGLKDLFFNSGSINLGAGSATTAAGIGGIKGAAAGVASSPAAGLAGAFLALNGIRRGSVLQGAAGGALAGFAVGGPIGAAIGAGIGGGAALISKLFFNAEKKVVDKVRSVYGITIDRGFAKSPILEAIRSQFGGNLDVGIRSPQIRELIELYALSTGQSPNGGFAPKLQPLSLAQRSGSLINLATATGSGLPSVASLTAPAPGSAPVNLTLVLSPEETRSFLETQTLSTVARNPGAVEGAVSAAYQANRNRREAAVRTLRPALVV